MPPATPSTMPLAALLGLALAASLALWAAGAPPRLVFAAAVPAWAAFAVLLRPMLRRYRAAMGLVATPGGQAPRSHGVSLKGLRVVALGFVTSALPFVAAAAQWLGGQDLTLFLAPRAAGRLGFLLGATLFLLPFLTSWLHLVALSEAAETTPATTPAAGEAGR